MDSQYDMDYQSLFHGSAIPLGSPLDKLEGSEYFSGCNRLHFHSCSEEGLNLEVQIPVNIKKARNFVESMQTVTIKFI